jgi:hypothetical protein
METDMERLRERANGHTLWCVAAAVLVAAALEATGILVYTVLLPLTG